MEDSPVIHSHDHSTVDSTDVSAPDCTTHLRGATAELQANTNPAIASVVRGSEGTEAAKVDSETEAEQREDTSKPLGQPLKGEEEDEKEEDSSKAPKKPTDSSEVFKGSENVPEAKRVMYMETMEELVGQTQAYLREVESHGNKQLLKHSKAALDRAVPLVDAWKERRAWGGEEKAIGVIKVLEALKARFSEWHGTIATVERLKNKVAEITRERNQLDLAAAKALPKALHCLNLRLAIVSVERGGEGGAEGGLGRWLLGEGEGLKRESHIWKQTFFLTIVFHFMLALLQ